MNNVHFLTNLPNRDSNGELIGEIKADLRGSGKDTCIVLYHGSWKITKEDFELKHPRDLADSMARLVELAMDAGFEQGKQHIRRALGIYK